jgi:SAM-dependent methyltransferase
MDIQEYDNMALFEDSYWWHVGRRRIIFRILEKYSHTYKQDILDIGCGTGGNYALLNQYGNVHGLDNAPEAITYCEEKGIPNISLGACEDMPYGNKSFDWIVALDVLEHLEDENMALGEFSRVLRPKGRLLLTVPAYAFIWSGHDEVLHHQRRYVRKQLKRLLEENGYSVHMISYMITFLAPVIIGVRLAERVTKRFMNINQKTSYIIPPKGINRFFIKLLHVEGRILKHIALPFGTSIICVARKHDKH